jgi:transglutaminase-like putative cysteine protease
MNMKYLIAGLFACTLFGTGCTRSAHFISNADYRKDVAETFETKKSLFADKSLFSVFDRDMTLQEREAMMFLYAYMPVGDVADYTGDFYLDNVRATFAAQQEMPWGNHIPETIFRHFVLPVRVNNESLDESRMIFYNELKNRVKGLSLHDAVLEVNHWCHEKVIYTPSDSRTSSPLASVKTAFGRCGEESTFTVAALRSVGIPARQVYTPRWAHTDDNHAWVEAWVDGQWCFMGACEPEPVLNLAWFNAPAYRGMLMHTKVFGRYDGPEEIMETTDCYTEINVIDHYAPVAQTTVTVVDDENRPVEGASVEFKLYNYAEFYPVACKTTGKDGRCSLSAGKGDMLVWATKDGRFGYGKVSFGKDEQLTVMLDKLPGDKILVELDMTPPVEGSIPAEVTNVQKAANAKRLAEEDDIRNAYTSTFYTEEKARALAEELSLDKKDVKEVTGYMLKSRGNWAEIETFLRNAPAEKRRQALALLGVISMKDLRDTPAPVLFDHLNHTPSIPGHLIDREEEGMDELFLRYVLNPRVANEMLTPYKQFFAVQTDAFLVAAARENPQALVAWVKQNVAVRDELNPQHIPVMPPGVWKARIADGRSRQIFFVAIARSMGIPARIEQVTGKVQYYNRQWMDVDFESNTQTVARQGFVTASYTGSPDNPAYYSHFTIAKIQSDGRLQTLDFEQNQAVDMGGGDTWAGLLKKPLAIDEGHYLLVSGTRMAGGNVLARIVSFAVRSSERTSTELVLREDGDDIRVIGSIDPEAVFLADGGKETTILNTTGRGYFVLGILGLHQEPTNHALRDIAAFREDFERWNRSILLLFGSEEELQSFDRNEFGTLPSTVACGVDAGHRVKTMLADAMNLHGAVPVFVIADTFGRVVFVSQGYTIGLGEQMMKVIRKL